MDIKDLGLSIDLEVNVDKLDRGITRAVSRLDDFSRSGMKAEDSARSLGARSDELAGSAERAARAMTQSAFAANQNARELQVAGAASRHAMQEMTNSYHLSGIEVASVANHFKTAAIAVYALSPAFRELANPAIAATMRALGPAAVAAGGAIISALSPALTFASRLSVPIFATVEAWKLLNYTIDRGSGLVEKYGNEQRNLIANVDANLAALTKFQDVGLSAQQVQYASELGARLGIAKQTISEFAQVQLDLTDPALRLQAAWVRVVETIAAGVDTANKLIGLIPDIPWGRIASGAASGVPIIGAAIPAVNALAGPSPEAPSQAEALAAAYQRLGAAMGSSSNFAVRFGQAINDLQNPQKAAAASTSQTVGEFDRAAKALERMTATRLADINTVGQSVGAQEYLRQAYRLTEAAMQQYDEVTDKTRMRIEELARRAGDAAQKLAELQLRADVRFDTSTLGLSDVDRGIASRLRGVYGDDWKSQMNGAIAQQMRFNDAIKQSQQLAGEFATGFAHDLRSGVSAMDALTNAAGRLSDRLIDMALNQAINGLFATLTKGLTGAPMNIAPSWMPNSHGNAFYGGNVIPFARGGIVDRATIFPMARGYGLMGEAGPEAVMPLRRGQDGRLGVVAAGGGGSRMVVNVINNAGSDVQVRQQSQPRQNSDGSISLDVVIERAVRNAVNSDVANNGPMTQGLARRFNLNSASGIA